MAGINSYSNRRYMYGSRFFYTAGPKPVSSTPFGEIFAGGFLGTVLFLLVCFVSNRKIYIFICSSFTSDFFVIAQILTVNNTCDIKGDRAAGRKTLSINCRKKNISILLFFLNQLQLPYLLWLQ